MQKLHAANVVAKHVKKVVKEEESRKAYTPQDVANIRATKPQKDEVAADLNQRQQRQAYVEARRFEQQRVKAKDVARAAARDRQRLLTNNGVDRLSPLAGTVVQESVGDGKKATQVAKKKTEEGR